MWARILVVVMIISGVSLIVCNLPEPPPSRDEVSVELGFELPGGEQVKKDSTIDTIGNQVKICIFLNLTQYLDSVVLKITMGADYEKNYTFSTYAGQITTATYPIIFSTPGNYTLTLTGYVDGELRTASGTITIVDRQQTDQNQKPVLSVPVLKKIGAGQTLRFFVSATDPDTNQQVTIIASEKPETATFSADTFQWTPTIADTGTDTVTFIAFDNGTPVKSDTEHVVIDISASPVNQAPYWIANYVQESAFSGVLFTYDLSGKCIDPDKDSLTFLLNPDSPARDTIIGSKYTFTPAASDTGKYTIRIVARDSSGLEDVLTLELTVSNNPVVDTKPPVFTRVSPAKDSVKVSSSSIQISVLCSDESKIDSVKCYRETTSFNIAKTGDSLYSTIVSGLITGWNTVTFVARDASSAKNPCTLLVHLNYDNTAPDNVPPIITFQSPSKDTVIDVDSFEVKVTCVDDSGCSVKGYRDGTAFTLKKSSSVANLWTGMAEGIIAESYSTIKIVATDSSAAKNMDSATVRIKYDNDESGPVFTLVNPAEDSVTTSTSSYTITVKCIDPSGVLSVIGTSGEATYTGVRDTGSLWKINISTLENNKVAAIVLTATDSSPKANKSRDTVYVKSVIVNGHSITFSKNDTTATGTMAKQTINSGDSARLSLNSFIKESSNFAGWAKTPAGELFYSDGANYTMGTDDDTLYAIWTINSFTITFDKNGGNVDAMPATKVVSSEATVDALPTPPTRIGFTFSGWNTSSSGNGTAFTATTPVTVNDTVFAQWTALAYSITYTLNGGTNNSGNPASYTVATPAIALANPTKAGFIFAGWFDNASLTGTAINSIPTGSTGDKAFWAKWTTDGYTITYNLNGGTNNVNNPASYDVTATTITLASPSKAGYTFGGWYDNASFTGTAVTSIPAGSVGNKAFWAKWTADVYTITYNLNGGTNNAGNPATYSITSAAITLVSPSRTGFTFVDWYANADFSGTAVTSIPAGSVGNKAFWAKWTADVYTITYNLNGGTNNAGNPATYSITSAAITLASPSRTGFIFVDWYANADFSGTAVTSIPAGSVGNKAFWAKWTADVYTITYNLNGGSNNVNNPASYNVTSAAITLAAPSRAGFTFDNWYDNASLAEPAVNSIPAGSTGDKAFWAKWTVVGYTITYNLNGGTNSVNNPATYNVTSATITLLAPSLIGHTFGGWYNNSNLNGQAITTIPSGSTGDLTFYAKWDVGIYKVIFSSPDATVMPVPTSIDFTYPATGTLPTPPQRDGYTFAGWWWTDNSGVSTQFVTGTSVTSNMTVIAKWNPIYYTVTFSSPDATDGNLVQTMSVTYNSTIAALPTSTRTNCKFAGWWSIEANGYSWQFTTQSRVTRDTTLEARWSVVDIEGNEYKVRKYGTQTWMVETFRSQHYNDDNSLIPMFTTAADWTGTTSGRASTAKDNATPNEIVTQGLLYNWYAVNSLRLAPTGWHVPTVQEFRTLLTTMKQNGYTASNCGSTSDTVYCVAQAIASEQYAWRSCGIQFTPGYSYTTNNSSKFNIYPSGYRDQAGALDSWRLWDVSLIWCSNVISPTTNGRVLRTGSCSVETSFQDYSKNYGFSVRFVKDSN